MDITVSRVIGVGRVVRAAAANALADFRATYTWYSWTFGWLGRMLCQVTFFALIGSFLDSPRRPAISSSATRWRRVSSRP